MTTNGVSPVEHLLDSIGAQSSDLIGAVVAAAKEHMDADVSFLAEFTGRDKVIRRSAGNTGGLREGSSFPLESTYCYRVAQGKLPNVVSDARNDARVKDLPITRELDIGSYVGVPVSLADGRLYGTLCCVSSHADPSFRLRDARFMRVLAALVAKELSRGEAATEDLRRKTERIRAAIAEGVIQIVFQPIVDLETREIVGAESLSRFTAEPRRGPDQWFAEAWEVGLGVELEVAAVRAAIAQFPRLPQPVYLSFNISPRTLQQEACREVIAATPAERLVVEVTEHAVIDDYPLLLEGVERLKHRGIRVAIDDVGAGYSGLNQILRVAPDIIKLDVSLTAGIHRDLAKQALASAVVDFASRTAARLVAEGIETAEDAETLRVLGVSFGQGYYFSRPGPLPLAVRSS